MHEDLDLTDIDLLVLCVVTGHYALEAIENLLSKEDRVLVRVLSSRAEYIEACVWEFRRRRPRYTRPAKVSSRFRHSHEARVLPKGSWKQPFLHRGWDVESFLGEGDKDPRWLANPSRECGCGLCRACDKGSWHGDRLPRQEAKRRAIEEELLHAREIADLEAISEDELDLMWLNDRVLWELEEEERFARIDRREELDLEMAEVAQGESWVSLIELMGATEDVQLRRDGLSIAHV